MLNVKTVPILIIKNFEWVDRSFIAQAIISVNMILSTFNSARCPNFMHPLNYVHYYVW